jgi:hypothetical protein
MSTTTNNNNKSYTAGGRQHTSPFVCWLTAKVRLRAREEECVLSLVCWFVLSSKSNFAFDERARVGWHMCYRHAVFNTVR